MEITNSSWITDTVEDDNFVLNNFVHMEISTMNNFLYIYRLPLCTKKIYNDNYNIYAFLGLFQILDFKMVLQFFYYFVSRDMSESPVLNMKSIKNKVTWIRKSKPKHILKSFQS